MAMDEAIAYTRIPAGTFHKWVAAGCIPAHGGRRKLFHRDELDAALGFDRPTLRLLKIGASC
jgi:excisionase family DNA binding protein